MCVCVFAYVCICVSMYVCDSVRTSVRAYIYIMYIRTYAYMSVSMSISMNVFICVCIYVYIYLYVCMYVCLPSMSESTLLAFCYQALASGCGRENVRNVTACW